MAFKKLILRKLTGFLCIMVDEQATLLLAALTGVQWLKSGRQ